MVRIITDSAADFEPQELEKHNITCVPMQISFDVNEYKENENLTKTQFYELLENSESFPKTSQPTPYDFEVLLEEFMGNGDECVIITISSALSGTYQNAFLVKNMIDYKNCYVVDSLNATAGQRLLVDYAVKLREESKSAKEIFDELEILKTKVKLYACVDTLEYLHKGGRLSKTAYTVGTLANIKPVIRISEEGKVEVSSKAMSIKGGISTVAKKLQTYTPDLNYPIYIVYSNNRKNGDLLAEAVKKSGFEVLPENIINIGATIGAHVGSGACGVIYVSDFQCEKENVDIYALSKDVVKRLTPIADKRNITFNIIGDTAKVYGARKILDEMIYNLCDNAIKYNKESGTVDVIVNQANGKTSVTVRDTGIGIPQSEQSRVFERFYRVDKSHSKLVGGTGLGLAIVKHGAAYHDADVSLESTDGKGTSVTISFRK